MDLLYNVDVANETYLQYNLSTLLDRYEYNEADADQYERTYKAGVYINNFYLWIIFAFGFPGNLASTITLSRMKPLTTSKFYVALLAIVDNLAIVLKLIFHQLTYHEIAIGTYGCRIMNVIVLSSVTYTNWIMVFMAIERFVAVAFPLRVSVLWNLNRARLSMSVLAVVIIGIYSHIFWTTVSPDSFQCGVSPEFVAFFKTVWYWINASVYSLVPFIILIVCNVLIIKRIKQSSQRRGQLYSDRELDSGSHLRRYERQITVMLLTVTISFLILTMPRTVFILVYFFWSPGRLSLNFARKYLFDQLTFALCDATHAVNFYLYFITGQQFRQSFIGIALGKKRHSSVALNHSRVQITHNVTGEQSFNSNGAVCKACVHMKGVGNIKMHVLKQRVTV